MLRVRMPTRRGGLFPRGSATEVEGLRGDSTGFVNVYMWPLCADEGVYVHST